MWKRINMMFAITAVSAVVIIVFLFSRGTLYLFENSTDVKQIRIDFLDDEKVITLENSDDIGRCINSLYRYNLCVHKADAIDSILPVHVHLITDENEVMIEMNRTCNSKRIVRIHGTSADSSGNVYYYLPQEFCDYVFRLIAEL